MTAAKFIAHQDVPAWLAELASAARVIAPVAEGSAVLYREYDPAGTLELVKKPTESAKHVLFPRSEALFSFKKEKIPFGPDKLGGTEKQEMEETPAPNLTLTQPEVSKPAVVFGMPGCDAGGVTTFDPVYGGRYQDPYYLQRREATVLIARACADVLSTCFCTWVGGDPANRRDADVLATSLKDGWLLEPLTERAERVLGSRLLCAPAVGLADEAEALHAAAREAIGPAPDLAGVEDGILARFDDRDFWWRHSAPCLACGVCTNLCPTCHCFTITDEKNGGAGVRLRSWDTCMAALYTLEASGHNPRGQKAARLRNRVGHKFSYFLKNNGGRISCCGCGRCIKSCPSSVDIRRIVLDALSGKGSVKEAANG
jgi:ferredoxin